MQVWDTRYARSLGIRRGGVGPPLQEAEILVVLHLPHELDRAREIVEIDHLVGRVGVPSRHPDAYGEVATTPCPRENSCRVGTK